MSCPQLTLPRSAPKARPMTAARAIPARVGLPPSPLPDLLCCCVGAVLAHACPACPGSAVRLLVADFDNGGSLTFVNLPPCPQCPPPKHRKRARPRRRPCRRRSKVDLNPPRCGDLVHSWPSCCLLGQLGGRRTLHGPDSCSPCPAEPHAQTEEQEEGASEQTDAKCALVLCSLTDG